MNRFLLALLLAICAATAFAETAQDHAFLLVQRRGFFHARGHVEGIGMSPVSAADARRRCCYFGRKVVIDEGAAWCPVRRVWIAVLRYAR